jgi:outer membrane protein assembly factor BamA
MRTQGFYNAAVKDTIIFSKKKASVHYIIETKQAYRIRSISYDISDTAIRSIILSDTNYSTIRPRRRLSIEMLDNERERITQLLRNKSYYAFNKGYINYEADTTAQNSLADLKLIISNPQGIDSLNAAKHKRYKINNIYIYTDYDPVEFYSNPEYLQQFDTLYTKDIYLLYQQRLGLRPGVIPRASLLFSGMEYNEAFVAQTYNNFSNLQIYKSVTIQFKELEQIDSTGYSLINCIIQLNPLKSQSIKGDIEMSLSSSDMIGFSPGLHYGHRNLLKGAELFSLDFRGVFQYSLPGSKNPKNSFEYNISSSISIPKFLAPLSIAYFKTQIPHTKFSMSYTYQQRPDYTRSVASASIGYLWNNSSKLSFIFTPIDFNMVKMLSLNTDFYNSLRNPYLRNTYDDHFILGTTGSIIFNNNQNPNADYVTRRYRRFSSYQFRINIDVGGNVLSLFNKLMKHNDSLNYYMVMNTRYAQYAKIDFSYIYNKPVQTRSNIVYRFVFGIGQAYGNSIALPFEKMFYAGGTNSLRGWLIRGVGPGSVQQDTSLNFSIPNQVADMRIELNAEYRFPLFWKFEGACFIDVGNIWSVSSKDPRQGAKFTTNFYKELAANTGLGLRWNLTYLIIRLDLGLRLHDPARPSGDRFVFINKWLHGDNHSINLGINYPF